MNTFYWAKLYRWDYLIFRWLITHLFSGTWQMEGSTYILEVWTEYQTQRLPGMSSREGFTMWQWMQTGNAISTCDGEKCQSSFLSEILGVLQYKWKDFLCLYNSHFGIFWKLRWRFLQDLFSPIHWIQLHWWEYLTNFSLRGGKS